MPKLTESELALDVLHGLGESTRKEDLECEQRVRFFLLIASGAIAILSIANRESSWFQSEWPTVFLAVLTILLAFGMTTLHFLNWRVVHRRERWLIHQRAEAVLKDCSPLIRKCHEISDAIERKKNDGSGPWRRTLRGSLAELMYLANSLLSAAIAYLICYKAGGPQICIILVSAMAFILVGVFQYAYCKWMRNIIPENWDPEK